MAENNGKIKAAEFRGMMMERTGIILKELETLQETVNDHTKSIERLKVKAGAWGLLGGALSATTMIVGAIVIWLVKGG